MLIKVTLFSKGIITPITLEGFVTRMDCSYMHSKVTKISKALITQFTLDGFENSMNWTDVVH